MTVWESGRFVTWFIWHDLRERRAWATTLAAVVGLSAIAFFLVMGNGLATGLERVRDQQQRENPLTLGLWVSRTTTKTITKETLEETVQSIRAKMGPGAVEGAYPIRELQKLSWQEKGGPDQPGGYLAGMVGRTLAKGDRLLASLKVTWLAQPSPGDDEDDWVVVNPKLLQRLGYAPCAQPPLKLVCKSENSGLEKVDVRGITGVDPPFEYLFLIPEKYAMKLQSLKEPPPQPHIWVGPVPDGWSSKQLPPEVSKWLNDNEVSLADTRHGDEGQPSVRVWQFNYNGLGVAPRVNAWQARVEWIRSQMAVWHPTPDASHFGDILDWPGRKKEAELAPLPEYYSQGVIYTGPNTDDRKVADLLDASGLQVRRDELTKSEALRDQTRLYQKLLWPCGLVLLAIGGLTVAVLQDLRMAPKISEMGMLRAMGLSNPMLLAIYQTEAAIIGLVSGLVGAWAGIGAGVVLARRIHPDHPELGFQLTDSWIPLVITLLWLTAALGSFVSTHRLHRMAPSQAISGG
jgi:hypothetical protein